MTFTKTLMKKISYLWQIFEIPIKCYYSAKFWYVEFLTVCRRCFEYFFAFLQGSPLSLLRIISATFCSGRDIEMVKSVRIRSYSGPRFPAFGLNTERYSQSEYGKMRIRKNTNQKNSEYGHFSGSAFCNLLPFFIPNFILISKIYFLK